MNYLLGIFVIILVIILGIILYKGVFPNAISLDKGTNVRGQQTFVYSGATNCPISSPYKCPDGTCKVSLRDCFYSGATPNVGSVHCPISSPYKCPDGTCKVSSRDCFY
jgi:hypothetical protein